MLGWEGFGRGCGEIFRGLSNAYGESCDWNGKKGACNRSSKSQYWAGVCGDLVNKE